MSGFTHRVTNQIRGAPVKPAEARHLLERGWISDQEWLLRELHEFAHVNLNFTPVGEAPVLADERDRLGPGVEEVVGLRFSVSWR